MMEFKVGDKVKVRTWESMEKEFGTNEVGSIACKCSFTEGMRKFCNMTMTICSDMGDGMYQMEEDGMQYVWSKDMIIPIPEKSCSLLAMLFQQKKTNP